jgi:sugar phosphate isomerase/epimerase
MTRPITLFTGQWADLPFEEMCRLASGWGYDGLEIACWGDHLDVRAAAEDDSYVRGQARPAGEAQPAGVRHLEPPDRPGRLR